MKSLLKRTGLLGALLLACALPPIVPAAATLQGLQVGSEAPDFTLADLSGDQVPLAEVQGDKLTAILFWSTWSSNSKKALLRLQELYHLHRNKGLSVVAVNVDAAEVTPEADAEIRALADQLELEFPVLLDPGLKVFGSYGVIALPSTIVISPENRIEYELSGYPLVGAEEMSRYIIAAITGEKPPETAVAGYRPARKALLLYNMGRNSLNSGRMAEMAGTWFEKAAEADPGFALPRLALGRFLQDRAKLEQAEAQYRGALDIEPENPVARCELGMLLVEKGEREKGIALLEQAAKDSESYTPCYYYLGYLLGREGDEERALALFERAREINRLDVDLYSYEGRMWEARQDLSRAAAAYRKALELGIASH